MTQHSNQYYITIQLVSKILGGGGGGSAPYKKILGGGSSPLSSPSPMPMHMQLPTGSHTHTLTLQLCSYVCMHEVKCGHGNTMRDSSNCACIHNIICTCTVATVLFNLATTGSPLLLTGMVTSVHTNMCVYVYVVCSVPYYSTRGTGVVTGCKKPGTKLIAFLTRPEQYKKFGTIGNCGHTLVYLMPTFLHINYHDMQLFFEYIAFTVLSFKSCACSQCIQSRV